MKKVKEIVKEYSKPVFGYAIKRTEDRKDAEELSQEIMFQVIKSIKVKTNIRNLENYIWTIARNTWIYWLNEKKNDNEIAIQGYTDILADFTFGPSEKIVDKEERAILHQEIAYLSETRRKVITYYYYHEMKQKKISEILDIPVGTVKWHLHEAKNNLKKGMKKMKRNDRLSFNPVELVNLGHCGKPGDKGETSDFLRSILAQNIIYSAYYEPKSVKELARELNIVPVFIKDEVEYLTDYEYLKEVKKINLELI